jgi:hypothetical protein
MTIGKALLLVILVLVQVSFAHAAQAGGGGKTAMAARKFTKKWSPFDYAALEGSTRPICLFVEDPVAAKSKPVVELQTTLSNDQVKLQDLQCVKIKSDGSDAKGWPQALLDAGKNGAAVIFMSSDRKQYQIFDSKIAEKSRTPELFKEAIAKIFKLEDLRRAQGNAGAKRELDQEKAREALAAKDAGLKIPGLEKPEEEKVKPAPAQATDE